MKKRQNPTKFSRLLELPTEVASGTSKITIQGSSQMLIENYQSVLEYQDIYIRIKTYFGIINISGFNLKLNDMTSDDVKIEGEIDSIDFERIE